MKSNTFDIPALKFALLIPITDISNTKLLNTITEEEIVRLCIDMYYHASIDLNKEYTVRIDHAFATHFLSKIKAGKYNDPKTKPIQIRNELCFLERYHCDYKVIQRVLNKSKK